MARCFNRNTKEYKNLLEAHGDPITVDLLINDWQSITGTEEIPTTDSIDVMLKGNDIMLSIIHNIILEVFNLILKKL